MVRGDTIFVPTFQSGAVALDRRTGERKWWAEEAKTPLAFGQEKIFFLTLDDKVAVLDEASGEVISSIVLPAVPSEYHGITNFDSEVLYLFTSDGFAIALASD
jgi:glucose dehydrogenase